MPTLPEAFKNICTTVGIDNWESIIEFRGEASNQTSWIRRKRFSSKQLLLISIVGTFEEVDKSRLDAIASSLRQLSGDMIIEVLEIDEGLVKLIVRGSEGTLRKIETLFRTGKLEQVEGHKVQTIHYLERDELVSLINKNSAIGLTLFSVDLSTANLVKADLRGTDFVGANFRETDLREANFTGSTLTRAGFSSADLRYANLSYVRSNGAFFSNADLTGADLIGANLVGTSFSNANLTRANLTNADLTSVTSFRSYKTNFSGANLKYACLRNTKLNKVLFSNADLTGADLTGTDLTGADFSNANLTWANFTNANLRDTNFSNAQVNKALMIDCKALDDRLRARGAIFSDLLKHQYSSVEAIGGLEYNLPFLQLEIMEANYSAPASSVPYLVSRSTPVRFCVGISFSNILENRNYLGKGKTISARFQLEAIGKEYSFEASVQTRADTFNYAMGHECVLEDIGIQQGLHQVACVIQLEPESDTATDSYVSGFGSIGGMSFEVFD